MSPSIKTVRIPLLLIFLLAAFCSAPFCAMAQTTESTQDLEYPEPAHESKETRHGIALFVGDTYFDGQNGFTLGMDYKYRFNRRIGIGGLVDYAGQDFRSFVAGIPITLHTTERLRFILAPCVEHADGENNALVRAGAGYNFPAGPVGLGPAFFVDWVDGETIYILGLSVGWEF